MKTLNECIKNPEIKLVEFNNQVNEMFSNLFRDINSCTKSAYSISNDYKTIIKKLSEMYFDNTNRKCYLTASKPHNLYNYMHFVGDRFNFTIDSYTKAMKYEIMMLLTCYGYLDECQIKLAFANVIVKLYRYLEKRFDDSVWFNFEINTIQNIYKTFMNTNIDELLKEFDDVTIKNELNNKLKVSILEDDLIPTKPKKAEHLTALYKDGMTQREWVKKIAAYWLCSEKTATRYLKKFDLWDSLKTEQSEPDYKALYEQAMKENELLKQQIKALQNPTVNINPSSLNVNEKLCETNINFPDLTVNNSNLKL